MKIEAAKIIRNDCFARTREAHSFPKNTDAVLREIVRSKDHVLRWHCDRLAILRRNNIVRREHEDRALQLRFIRKRHVHRHLIAVEIGVERRTYERMDLKGAAFDQAWLERLDTQTVQRRRAVQHD